jgi:hypothetical protein
MHETRWNPFSVGPCWLRKARVVLLFWAQATACRPAAQPAESQRPSSDPKSIPPDALMTCFFPSSHGMGRGHRNFRDAAIQSIEEPPGGIVCWV